MKENSISRGTAVAKIILMGEHAVVYGQPALAIPFKEAKITVDVEASTGPIHIDSDIYVGNIDDVPDIIKPLRDIVYRVLDKFNEKKENLSFTVRGNIPYSKGMGSSAALSTAIVRALYSFFERQLSIETTLKWVNQSEDVIHGSSSGIDANVVIKEQAAYFIKGQDIEDLILNLDAYLLIADTGIAGQTKEAVSAIRELLEKDPIYQMDIEALGNFAKEARSCVENNDPYRLGILMNQAQILLKKLSVSNPSLDLFVDISNEKQALGAKLTGGGRGGCMIALFENEDQAKEAETALLAAGASQTWIAHLGGKHEES